MDKRSCVYELFGSIEAGKSFEPLYRNMRYLLEGDDEERNQFQPVLLVGSQGGSTEEAVRIYSFLKQLPQSLVTIAVGEVSSAAVLVYLAGQRRLATPTSSFMIHDGVMSFNRVPPHEVGRMVKESRVKERVNRCIVAESTGKSTALVNRWFRSSVYFSADEAIRNGLAHEIITAPFFLGQVAQLIPRELL